VILLIFIDEHLIIRSVVHEERKVRSSSSPENTVNQGRVGELPRKQPEGKANNGQNRDEMRRI
jgi:hypothetical protein